MADNVPITPGSGATIATDDVSGVQYQRIKIDLGGNGAADPFERGQTIGKVDHTTASLGHGHKEVTTAGTPVQLASTTAAKYVTVQAYAANTGRIAVGGANTVSASATIGTGTGIALLAGESITLPIDDLADVWLDASVNGEGVRYIYGAA